MGRPIDPRKIGALVTAGSQIRVYGILDIGTGVEALFITGQKNKTTFHCSSTNLARTGLITLQQATPVAVGQGRVAVTPFNDPTATATATMKVVSMTVNNPGSGYSPADVLTVSTGTGTKATITVNTVDGFGAITGATLTTGGTYTVLPTLTGVATTVAPAGGTAATVNVVMGIRAITPVLGGSGYDDAPAVTITGAGGVGAAAHAVLTNGVVTSIVVDTVGSGFTVVASVGIAGSLEYASGIQQHNVKTFEGNIYKYQVGVAAAAANEATIDVA